MPPEWVVSRICEEFGLAPSVAMAEWRRHPDMVLRVLDFRAYARAYRLVRDARNEEDLPKDDPYVDLVFEMTQRQMRRRRE